MSTALLGLSIAAIDDALSPVLAHVDFGAATAISTIDIVDAVLSGAALAGALAAQYSINNVAWTVFGDPATLGGGARSRRFAASPGAPVSARYWRVIVGDLPGADGRSLSIASIVFRAETGDLSTPRCFPHFIGDSAAYMHVMSDLTSDVYSGGARQASIATPFTSGVLGSVDFAQDIDTLLTFNAQVSPWRFFRQGSGDEWDSRAAVFTNVPLFEFPDATYVNGVDEVQQISFSSFVNLDTFTLTFDGQSTGSVVYSSTPATNVANIKAALEALAVMGGGTVAVANTSGSIYSVTFQGAAGATDWAELAAQTVSSAAGIVTTATLTEGKPGGEPIMSAARGWPRTGVFWQSRLILGGLAGTPQTALASTFGDYFNFHAAGRRATDGLEFTVDANDTSGIRQIIAARYLVMFTATGEFHVTVDSLVGDDANPVVQDHQNGIQSAIRPEILDGAILYVQNGGRAVRELTYTDGRAGYVSANISVRAPFLVQQPIDAFAQRGGFVFECDRYHLVRRDGMLAVFQSLRGQDFAAWSRYTTSGKFLTGAAEEMGPVYVVVEREVDGATVRYVEGLDPSRLLDSSILVELEAAAATLTGLSHLEAREDVWAVGSNGYFYGPFTVEAGVIARADGLPFEAATYEVGLWFDAWIDTMPVRVQSEGGSIAELRKRVCAASVSLLNSCAPELVYLKTVRSFPQQRFGDGLLDAPPLDNLVTGRLRVAHLLGFTRDAQVRIRRRVPGPLHIRSMGLEVSY